MAEYPAYKHGTRAEINANGISVTDKGNSNQAIVYIGTAPVNQVENGAKNVNVPILCNDMSDVRRYLGYSDNWAGYTLCEAMHVHFEVNGVGPLVFINVLDPAVHIATTNVSESKTPSSGTITLSNASLILVDTIAVATKTKGTDYTVSVDTDSDTVIISEKTSGSLGTDALTVTYLKKVMSTSSLTPENGRVRIANAENVILDSVVVSDGVNIKVKDTDYTIAYDYNRKAINITEKTSGSLGTSALTVTYFSVDPSTVSEADVIGSTDTYGLNTGTYVLKNVYNITGYIPAFIVAPAFSSIPNIHNAMYLNSQQIAGHWNAWMFVDMPITDSLGAAITMASAPTWKNANGYNKDNEDVFFPLVKGIDGKTYHISVLNAANFQALLIQNNGIPYMTGSNTPVSIIQDLYMGEAVQGRIFTDDIINRCLNANGINSAAYVGGRWVIWGMHAGSYSQDNATNVNVFDTCLMMLYYVTNDFQHRRNSAVDKPMSVNALQTIAAEEQSRIDALVGTGALTYGKVILDVSKDAQSDMIQGNFRIEFKLTNTPLAKSITGIATWVDDGFTIYIQAITAAA